MPFRRSTCTNRGTGALPGLGDEDQVSHLKLAAHRYTGGLGDRQRYAAASPLRCRALSPLSWHPPGRRRRSHWSHGPFRSGAPRRPCHAMPHRQEHTAAAAVRKRDGRGVATALPTRSSAVMNRTCAPRSSSAALRSPGGLQCHRHRSASRGDACLATPGNAALQPLAPRTPRASSARRAGDRAPRTAHHAHRSAASPADNAVVEATASGPSALSPCPHVPTAVAPVLLHPCPYPACVRYLWAFWRGHGRRRGPFKGHSPPPPQPRPSCIGGCHAAAHMTTAQPPLHEAPRTTSGCKMESAAAGWSLHTIHRRVTPDAPRGINLVK